MIIITIIGRGSICADHGYQRGAPRASLSLSSYIYIYIYIHTYVCTYVITYHNMIIILYTLYVLCHREGCSQGPARNTTSTRTERACLIGGAWSRVARRHLGPKRGALHRAWVVRRHCVARPRIGLAHCRTGPCVSGGISCLTLLV